MQIGELSAFLSGRMEIVKKPKTYVGGKLVPSTSVPWKTVYPHVDDGN
jgi:hypothetical protein